MSRTVIVVGSCDGPVDQFVVPDEFDMLAAVRAHHQWCVEGYRFPILGTWTHRDGREIPRMYDFAEWLRMYHHFPDGELELIYA